ncbi:MAG TPA: TonB-dependent receptor plug domain-containing protein [Kofleriaceae bacterium]
MSALLCRFVPICVAFAAAPAFGDELGDISDITDVSLDDLLNTDVDVASKVPQTYREVPGVVTVITREEIMDSGARDLEDVLRLVPGFSMGIDVEAIVSIGVRGNWAHEGKMLLLIDGQQMNETLYSTNALGNHYPVDQIERIEIIRGPGSAIYGGYAELAVINIVTRGADQLNGVAIYGHAGLNTDTYGHLNLSVAAGQTLPGGLKLSLSGLFGQGHRSNADYSDFYGDTFPLTEHEIDPGYVNVGAQWKDLSLRFIYDHYGVDERDGLGQNETQRFDQKFVGYYGELAYKWRAREGLTITPVINYKRQLPWNILDQSSGVFYDKTAERVTGAVSASYDVKENLNVLGGAEVYWDHAFLNQPAVMDTLQTQFGSSDSVSYLNEAVFAQGLLEHSFANVTVGARFEHHSQVGNSFVPRVAVTRVFEPAHIKVLYSEAFRAPGFENINLAPDPMTPVSPERTRVGELETGYSIDDHNFVTFNGYWIRINKPIVYFVDAAAEGYQNLPRTGTLGVEATYKLRYKWGYGSLSYSYYAAQGNEVSSYAVPGHASPLLGMPQHKLTMHGAWNAWKNLRVAPSFLVNSGPWAYTQPNDGAGVGTLTHADASVLVNLFVSYRDLGMKGVEAGVGLHNILDDENHYYQPYDGGHAPMRGSPRQLLLRVGYTHPL